MFTFHSEDSESDFNDFSDTPTYIRKDVQSCSNFNYTEKHNESTLVDLIINNKDSIRQLSLEDGNYDNSDKFNTHLLLENQPAYSLEHSQFEYNFGTISEKVEMDGESGSRRMNDKMDITEFKKPSFKYNESESPPKFDNDFNSVLLSEDSIEEWNAEEDAFSSRHENKFDSFSALMYSTPKTFSASFTRIINNLFENPEGRMTKSQRIAILLFAFFEAYRIIISSFLIVFVPQNCGGYSCTILQNIIPKDKLEVVAISINTFMAVYFCTLFAIERGRESLVKQYFIYDKSFSTDKDYLITMISEMKPIEQRRILKLNRVYRGFSQFLLLLFFVNAGISSVVIEKNYLNNTTSTVFITNAFFMINRIYKALKITSSGEYNIYSAYRSQNLLYNRYRGKITHTNV